MNISEMRQKYAPPKAVFDQAERAFIGERYNLGNVVRSLAGELGADIGFEREVSEEMRRRADIKNVSHGGLAVPYCALQRMYTGKTNVDGVITGNGAAIVATDLLTGEYINPLTARLVLRNAGARFIDGLVGDIAVPKGSCVGACWVTGEGGEVAKTHPSFSQVLGTPHTLGAYVDVTRKLVVQSALPVQNLIGDLIFDAVAREIDAAGLAGTGSDGQPLGLIGTAGVNEVDGITANSPTFLDIQNFIAELDDANVDMAELKWLAPARVKAKLASTIDANLVKNVAGTENVGAVTSARYLCEKSTVADYPLLTSNLCPAKKLILGDWKQLLIAGWGEGIDLLADPFSNSTSGSIRIVAFKEVDVLVRYPEAFAVGTILA